MNRVFILAVFVASSSVSAQSGDCNQRWYDQNSFICVCDDNGCDFPGRTVFPEQGQYIRIRTSRDEFRFASVEGTIDSENTGETTIDIDTQNRRQSTFGFGGAFTDSTGINVMQMSESLIDTWVRSYFAPEGVEYNFCRVPIAGSDFSVRPYSYDEVWNDTALEFFALAPEDYNYKFPLIKAAMNYTERVLNLLGSPWAPPPWMKTNGMHNGSGSLIYEMWDPYADYLIKFVEAYEDEGVPIWGVTPQNEPLTGYEDWPWNTCAFSAENMTDWIRESFGPALDAAGLRPRLQVMTLDHNRDSIPYYPATTFDDPDAEPYVDGTAMHWYFDYYIAPTVLNDLHNQYPNKYIMYTEACEGWNAAPDERVLFGNWERGQNYAQNIIEDLNHWSKGWIDWNMALNPQGGPNWAANFVESPIITNQTEFLKQPTFYVMGHFSKYIQPGDSHLSSIIINGYSEIESAAFVRDDGQQVIVILNKGDVEHNVTIMNDGSPLFTVEILRKSIESIMFYP